MWKRLVNATGTGICAAVVVLVGSYHAQQPAKVDFIRDVQPILREQCYR